MVENDFEAIEQRQPRAPRQVGDPVDDNIDHPPDLEEDKDETNDDDKEIMIPPDPAHEAKIAVLGAAYTRNPGGHTTMQGGASS